jgi:DNA repair protein RadD
VVAGITLRPYQQDALNAVLDAFQRQRSVLLEAACGAGKTILFSSIIRHFAEKYPAMRSVILAHREQLVKQARDKLLKVWPEGEDKVGMACKSACSTIELEKPVVIASPQTLAARIGSMPPVQLAIVDEVHRLPPADRKSQYGGLMEALRGYYPEMRLLGVTATPYRLNHGYIYGDKCRHPEQNWFSDLSYKVGIYDLQAQGFLVPLKLYIADEPDLSDVGTSSTGDWNIDELAEAMSKSVHVNSAVEAVQRYASDRKHIVVFGVTIEHAEVLRDVFREAGYSTVAVHSKMPKAERDAALYAFDRGDVQVVCNVGVLTEGWDCTSVDCMVMCRPTKSAALYCQMAGRGLRLHEGKTDCLMLDLSGNYAEHGRPEEPRVKMGRESGEGDGSWECPECHFVNEPKDKVCASCGYERPEPEPEMRDCPHCRFPFPANKLVCPHCGQVRSQRKAVELHEVKRDIDLLPKLVEIAFEPVVNTDFVSRKGNAMIEIRLLVSEGGDLPFQVNDYLDFDGTAGEWSRCRAHQKWMRLASTNPPRTLSEAKERISELNFPPRVLIKRDKTGKYWNVAGW